MVYFLGTKKNKRIFLFLNNYLVLSSHSNLYFEFFKNLPNSFTLKSNYQVAIFFTTIKNESIKSLDNIDSLSKYIAPIMKEIFSFLLKYILKYP